MIALTDQSPMPFGARKGEKMETLRADYLLFLWDKFLWNCDDQGREDYDRVAQYIIENFAGLETEASDYIIKHRPPGK